jgi:hypothetical protein
MLVCLLFALSLNAYASVSNEGCLPIESLKEAEWRARSTNTLDKGLVVPTSKSREQDIRYAAQSMENVILNFQGEYGTGDIPPMRIFPAIGTDMILTRSWSYKPREIAPAFRISKLGESGLFRFTQLGPVSGHNGNENARRWALTDKYYIAVAEGKDIGPSLGGYGVPKGVTLIVDQAPSRDLVTAHEVELVLKPNVPTFIYYWRQGSAGVAGYPSGRTIEVVWDGT